MKQDIRRINDELLSFVSKAKLLPFVKEGAFRDWERICTETKAQITDDVFHIVVVGAIKSGKSTLVNYLFHGDYLKRGAGIVTSFVTRVRKRDSLRAILQLKAWKEINMEMERAIRSISLYEPKLKGILPFDMRDPHQVEGLYDIIKGLDLNLFLKDGTQDINYLILSLYLKGYEYLKNMVSDEEKQVIYEKEEFEKHKMFVGNDNLAIYLKDVIVEINTGIFDESVEVADCQGSDSPNPLHLLMIQEHLTGSQLVIYVISSRMGVREADIKFLYTIKKIGMMDDLIFVINCDFDEHESVQELRDIVDKIKNQILFLVPHPRFFTFSALFNLLKEIDKNRGETLSKKERLRLYQWQDEKGLMNFSNCETHRFLDYLKDTLYEERYAVLTKSWLERLHFVSLDMKDWISVNRDIVTGNKLLSEELIQKLRTHKAKLDKIKLLLTNTLQGASDKLKGEMKRYIDQFFDSDGELLVGLKTFINQFHISRDRYMEMLQHHNMSHALYMVFMEYKRAIDIFIVENINPLIIRFIKEIDKKIENGFISVLEPYHDMLREAVTEFKRKTNKAHVVDLERVINLEHVKKDHNIKPPSIVAALEYNILLTPETIMRFGIYRFFTLIRKVFKKRPEDPANEKIKALEDGLLRIKRQGFDSLMFNLTNYKENLKYQYAFLIIDACKNYIVDSVDEQLKNGLERFLNIEEEIKKEQFDKESTLKELSKLGSELNNLIFYIEKLGNFGSFTHLLK